MLFILMHVLYLIIIAVTCRNEFDQNYIVGKLMKAVFIGITLFSVITGLLFLSSKADLPQIPVSQSSEAQVLPNSPNAAANSVADFQPEIVTDIPENQNNGDVLGLAVNQERLREINDFINEDHSYESQESQSDYAVDESSVNVSEFKKIFISDTKDGDLSYSAENHYINMLSQEESLAGYVLAEADCKTSICKISFSVANEEQKDKLANDLIEILLAKNQRFGVSFNYDERPGYADFYLERPKLNE
jgi:hypothetical protein